MHIACFNTCSFNWTTFCFYYSLWL